MKKKLLLSLFSKAFLGIILLSLPAMTFAQAVGDYGSAGTGNWGTDGTNWLVCVTAGQWTDATAATSAPGASTNVWIRTGHTVTVEATSKLCNNLTVESNAILIYTSGYITGTTGSTLSLLANSSWKQAGTASAMPCTNKTFDKASTVEFNGSQSSLSVYSYGNLIWASSSTCGIASGNSLVVAGNLTLKKSMRGISSTSGTNTHAISGNVVVDGSGVYLSGVNNSAATTATAVWNIGGDVTLSNGSRIVLFESAGPQTGSSTFNIGGNLTIGSSCILQLRSSTSTTASTGIGTVNLKGNITNYGQISTTSGATSASGMVLALNGASAQTWTGSFPKVFGTPQTCNITIDNTAGVSLAKSDTLNTLSTLTFTNGTLALGDNNLWVNGGQIANCTSDKFIVTNGTGKLIQSAPAATATLFPIGASTSSYDPVTVTPASTSDFTIGVSSVLSGSAASGVSYNAKEWSVASSLPSSTLLSFTPSAVTASATPIIGLYTSGAYSNSSATLNGSAFSATFSSFGSFVTGSSSVSDVVNPNRDELIFSVANNVLTIQHAQQGDRIAIYNACGQSVCQLIAGSSAVSCTLTSGMYIVKVKNELRKIVL